VDGFLMFSCLGPDSLVELVRLYESLGWGRPLPAWVDMHDLGDMMVEAGFADPVMDQERLRLTWSEPEKLLADLRALGGNVSPARFPGLRTPRWRARLLAALEGLRGPDGLIALSLELVYGHAFKPVPRPRVSGETHVSLDDMRSMVRRQGKD
ncbi:MAG TPA: biotin synthase, partial [Burkholderiaceae bacterium]|nr:biotin synthase [Burkholderiaceae bacterium]